MGRSGGLRRVVVTGMGVVSAPGNDVDTFWENMRAGRSGIRLVQRINEQWTSMQETPEAMIAAQVTHQPPYGFEGRVSPESVDAFSLFALMAARQAMEQSGFGFLMERKDRIGTVLGTAKGGEDARDQASFRVYVKKRPPAPQTLIRAMANGGASTVSIAFGLRGPTYSVVSACASATHAIGQAYRMIRHGLADIMLAGGSEQLPSLSLYRAWRQMRVLSPDGCRPFSASRNGLVLGEGAGVLVMETLDSALERGAPILGEICGFAMNASAADWTRPDAGSMADCIEQGLADAGARPEEVGFVMAHGTGTWHNDLAETQAIRQALGRHGERVPVTGGKAMHGHALGATGAMECITALLALRHGTVPPISAEHEADSACALNIVNGSALAHRGRFAVCNAFAFGGLHGVLVLAPRPPEAVTST